MTNAAEITTWEAIKATPTDAVRDIDLAIRNAKSIVKMILWEDFFPFPAKMPKAERAQKIAEIKADPAQLEIVTARLVDTFVKAEAEYRNERNRRPSYTKRPTTTEMSMYAEMLQKRAIVARWLSEL